jgi:DNA-binding NarL/FixJ family response regulator
VAPDLVEARVELEDLVAARPVVSRLRDLAEQQEHPWALATAQRCEALLRLAAGDDPERAAVELAAAAETLGELGLPLDQARALLALGKAQRRRKQWSAARRALDEATALFEAVGATGWAALARAEAARVAPRRSGVDDVLTPSQRRVVELASEGLSNKEIAQSLVVSVRTVETHLSAAFLKLRVTSRAQLARRLSGRA